MSEHVDVDALIGDVRRRLEEARPAAAAPSDAASVSPAPAGPAEPPLPGEALARSLELLRRAPRADPRAPLSSHRAGVGRLVVSAKRIARKLLFPVFAALFDASAARDQAGRDYAEEVYRRLVGMEADLRARLERVEARQAMELETLRRRVAALERTDAET